METSGRASGFVPDMESGQLACPLATETATLKRLFGDKALPGWVGNLPYPAWSAKEVMGTLSITYSLAIFAAFGCPSVNSRNPISPDTLVSSK